jgi:glycosyltransferase involved in cell wall biosynthesis
VALGRIQGVEVVGEVADVRPYLQRAAVAVAPLTFGGGSRLKILEALAMGKAVVSTPKGAEGLELIDGEHLAIRALDDFPEAIASLLSDPQRRRQLGAAGRAFVQAEHDWSSLAERLTESVEALLRNS